MKPIANHDDFRRFARLIRDVNRECIRLSLTQKVSKLLMAIRRIIIEAKSILHAQAATLDDSFQVLPWLLRNVLSLRRVMLLDVQDDIKTDDIHLLEWTFWRFQDAFEDLVDLLRRGDPF